MTGEFETRQSFGSTIPDGAPVESMTPEEIRRKNEMYTIEGSREIIEFKEAMESGEIGKIQKAVERAASFMEGLPKGVEASRYNLGSRREMVKLMNLFTTIEDSTSRRNNLQVLMAVREGLTDAIKESWYFEDDPNAWEARVRATANMHRTQESHSRVNQQGLPSYTREELDALVAADVQRAKRRVENFVQHRETFASLDEHVETRVLMFDQAFIARQKACTREEAQVEISNAGLQPDKGHWMAFYQGNATSEIETSKWGDAVSRTERAILDIAHGRVAVEGMSPQESRDIYINGFHSVGEFTSWVATLLKYTSLEDEGEQRMDVLWSAWKMCLWKESITRFAWGIDENTGAYRFASPPFGSDLMVKLIHPAKSFAMEYGWSAFAEDGNIVDLDSWTVVDPNSRAKVRNLTNEEFEKWVKSQNSKKRTKSYKAISHSGHPMSIGRIGRLVDDYPHHAKIKKWRDPRDPHSAPEDLTLFDIFYNKNMSMADPNFPWADTEIRTGREEPGEFPSGTTGSWQLNWVRGSAVRKMLREIPPANQMTLDMLQTQFRNWDKLGLVRPSKDERLKGDPENPVVWYLSGIIYFRSLHTNRRWIGDPRGYKSGDKADKAALSSVGQAAMVSDADIINNAVTSGLIGDADADWMNANVTSPNVTWRPKD